MDPPPPDGEQLAVGLPLLALAITHAIALGVGVRRTSNCSQQRTAWDFAHGDRGRLQRAQQAASRKQEQRRAQAVARRAAGADRRPPPEAVQKLLASLVPTPRDWHCIRRECAPSLEACVAAAASSQSVCNRQPAASCLVVQIDPAIQAELRCYPDAEVCAAAAHRIAMTAGRDLRTLTDCYRIPAHVPAESPDAALPSP